MADKQLILVAVKGNMHKQVFGPAIPAVIGLKKKQLKSQYDGWDLQIRTVDGYKVVKIYKNKIWNKKS